MLPHHRLGTIALIFFGLTLSSHAADGRLPQLPDGRYRVVVKDVTVALPKDDPENTRIQFQTAAPAGKAPDLFRVFDLGRDPEKYLSKLKSSEWSAVVASANRKNDILGTKIVKGVFNVGLLSGKDANCAAWKLDWERYRATAINEKADQYGWIRLGEPQDPSSKFIKFLDNQTRAGSPYHTLVCDFAGYCLLSTCHDDLTVWIKINSSNKIQGEDYSVKISTSRSLAEPRFSSEC